MEKAFLKEKGDFLKEGKRQSFLSFILQQFIVECGELTHFENSTSVTSDNCCNKYKYTSQE